MYGETSTIVSRVHKINAYYKTLKLISQTCHQYKLQVHDSRATEMHSLQW